jgi:NitT/TauT family transport system permease protein
MIQNMPKVALAPLIVVWFGFDIGSKIATVVLICFFPVFINTIAGIRQASNDHLDVLRASAATRMTLFLKVKLPSAAGTIFAGLQIGVTLALIGAIVAEFIASNQGLGVLIQRAAIDLNTPLMLTGVLTLGAMGLIGNAIVVALKKWIVFWERSAYSIHKKTPEE